MTNWSVLRLAALTGIALTTAGQLASADPYRLLLESNDNRASGAEAFYFTYSTLNNMLGGSSSGGQFSPIDIGEPYSTGGLTWDGSDYRLVIESNADNGPGGEFFFLTYDTWEDVLADDFTMGQFASLDIGPLWSSGGLAWDGTAYRLLLESNTDSGAGGDAFYLTYNTWADVVAGTHSAAQFGFIDINLDFSAGGLTFDGNQYHLLLESDVDSPTQDLFLVSYNSWADVVSDTRAGQQFSNINVGPDFSVGGFAAEFQAVPEPTSMACLALGGLALLARRKRKGTTRNV